MVWIDSLNYFFFFFILVFPFFFCRLCCRKFIHATAERHGKKKKKSLYRLVAYGGKRYTDVSMFSVSIITAIRIRASSLTITFNDNELCTCIDTLYIPSPAAIDSLINYCYGSIQVSEK